MKQLFFFTLMAFCGLEMVRADIGSLSLKAYLGERVRA
jgi:hypothetical protein